jgi:hypothetical protein
MEVSLTMSKQSKEKTFIYTLPSERKFEESVFGAPVTVNYVYRMYFGTTKKQGQYKHHRDLVEVKAYGLVIIRTVEFEEPMSKNAQSSLQREGYKLVDDCIAILTKDFGYLTCQNYELNHLIQSINRNGSLNQWDVLKEYVDEESGRWGDPVLDVTGRVTLRENGKVRKDPFAKSARLALRKKIGHTMGPLQAIKDTLKDLGNGSNNDKGVGM